MSETEALPTEPMEPEAPPEEEPSVEPEPEQEPEPEPEPTPDEGQSLDAQKAELDELYSKLNTKARNYVKGVGDLLEETVAPLCVCEMCADAFPGVRWLEASDETHAQLIAVVQGGASLDSLEADPDAETCPTCQGKGAVRLPSTVAGNQARTCRRCNGVGYLERHSESGALIAAAPEPGNGQAQPMPGVPKDDPVLADYAARGYTIVPPMQTAPVET